MRADLDRAKGPSTYMEMGTWRTGFPMRSDSQYTDHSGAACEAHTGSGRFATEA